MATHKRQNKKFHKWKNLVIVFSLVFSAIIGLSLPLLFSSANPSPLADTIPKESTEDETVRVYVTAFFFKDEMFEIYEDEPNILRFLISEKNGIADYNGITEARVEIPSGQSESIKINVNPFTIKAVGVGRNIVFITAVQRDGTPKTISAVFDVKKKTSNVLNEQKEEQEQKENNEQTDGKTQEENKTDNHSVVYEYSAEKGKLKIFYYINNTLQDSDSYLIVTCQGGEITGEGNAGVYQFWAQEKWEITVRHISTQKEITFGP